MIKNKLYRTATHLLSPHGKRARLTTLIYHRVLPQADPLFPDETTEERFDSELTALKSIFNILPLSEAVHHLKNGSLPSRAACITFDDGYADNFELATPILKKHKLVATFFIATDYLDGGRMFNDTIIESIKLSPLDKINLNAIGLDTFSITTDAEKKDAIQKLIGCIKYRPVDERTEKAMIIAEACQCLDKLPNNLMMSRQQVLAMRKSGMEIGGHTASHPILATLNDDHAYADIEAGKRYLETLLNEKVTLFAYPNGKPETDYKPEQTAIIRELGFDAAVSTTHGAASYKSDIFQLPRFAPWGSMKKFIPLLLRNFTQ